MCRHGSPTDGDGVMAWKEPDTRKIGSGTAVMIAGKGWESGSVQGLKEGTSAGVLYVVRESFSKPSHNTNCVNFQRELMRTRLNL